MSEGRIRASFPASGSVLAGDIVETRGNRPHRSFRVIPDGLLEEVIIREGENNWIIAENPE